MDVNILHQYIELYMELGWNIIPAPLHSKHPIISWGEFQKRKVTEEEVKVWFQEPHNIALITGSISNDVFVIDFDNKSGLVEENVKWLQNQWDFLDWGTVPYSITPSGGRHYFFRSDELIKNTTKQIRPDVDTKGEGGIIILPPSELPNGVYRWVIEPNTENIPFISTEYIKKINIFYCIIIH